jgi:hypothetical protein
MTSTTSTNTITWQTPIIDILLPHATIPKRAPKGLIWGFRTSKSRGGYRYPYAGRWAYPVNGWIDPPSTPCGRGLHVAKTFYGASRGGHDANRVLIVGYRPESIVAQDEHKIRCSALYVACRLDLTALIRSGHLRGADLWKANLREANLRKANLRKANLRGANLQEANLRGANLQKANLQWADLREADLRRADLQEANLREADLRGADLRGTDLRGALR